MSTPPPGNQPVNPAHPPTTPPGQAPPPTAPRQDDLLRKPPGPGAPGQAPQPGQAPPSGPPAPSGGQGPDDSQAFHTPAGFDDRGRVKRGRVSAAWVGSIAAAIVLILLIIFIAQNLNRASLHFLGLSGHMPLGLMLLIAAVAGVLLVAVPGSIRILQLRRALKANTPPEQRVPDTGGAAR